MHKPALSEVEGVSFVVNAVSGHIAPEILGMYIHVDSMYMKCYPLKRKGAFTWEQLPDRTNIFSWMQ